MHDVSSFEHATLIDHLEALGRDLTATRIELSRLSTEDLGTWEIPSATAELRAIVTQTEGAANRILDGCEALDRLGTLLAGGERPEVSSALFAATQGIYAACEFQDLTGQRVSNVVASLRAIERRVSAVTTALRGPQRPGGPLPDAQGGPPPAEPAMSQHDVDSLMRADAA